MKKRVAILQSNYLPWKGYFDIISRVDEFIFHDDIQYTKNDWRNRNRIKTQDGPKWLTIPCGTSEKRKICDVKLESSTWQISHWNKIKNSYSRARYFQQYREIFEDFYLNRTWSNLSTLNQHLIKTICKEILDIRTTFSDSREFKLTKQKGERVKELLLKSEAEIYLSGPSAKAYLSDKELELVNIEIEWMNYNNYPQYPQLWGEFIHDLSILDVIFNCGPNSKYFIQQGAS